MNIKHTSFARNMRVLLVLLVAAGLWGCSSIPVQEMSDARQAINAARDEGISIETSQDYVDALRLIKLAQQKLEEGDYKQARINALSAKKKALVARQQVQETKK
ncbi:MAG: DUF4398 domain-containing protein [Gammaproteobacteria bacterium]|nr:DUF4398 domain-containing protein [Gammaproteobacteria bacterium]